MHPQLLEDSPSDGYESRVRKLFSSDVHPTPFALEGHITKATKENKMHVMIHGDCWFNNMMFKYE